MNLEISTLLSKLYKTNEYGYEYQNPEAIPDPRLVEYYERKHGIRTDVHRTCVNCQIRQIEKYKENGNDFKVRCNFIPKSLPKGSSAKLKELSLKNDIDEERAKKLLLSTIDPVAWAELMFGFNDEDEKWNIRSYQKEQLRCSSLRVAAREGRRSGKTFIMALKLIYLAFNMQVQKGRDSDGNPVTMGPDIMIVTPYQAQLTNIFEEIEALIKRNIDLRKEVVTGTADNLYIKTPVFRMEFKNGCSIQGFVSGLGVKADGSGGGTMRGQSAHVIYLDEMDMIPEDILDKVINPILATTPDTMLLATSTPIGKRAKFYNWCVNREDFKEDYFPTTVLPHWEQIKDEIESESTKESFAAEYMAEFIEGSYGVFKPSWIQNARADYEYFSSGRSNVVQLRSVLDLEDPADLLIAIGIDWNKRAGTEFYVIGFSPTSRHWYALDAVNVSGGEASAQRWIKEVIRLNFKWKPNWIYADEGYGHTVIEDLIYMAERLRPKANKTPVDVETIKLGDRLVAYNFSKNVILKDPVTGQDIKKAGKHFLVENAVRIFEDGLFKYPESDETLRKQLHNYVILRRHATTNKPVFGMDNERIGDHRLDAMMLALAALSLEESVYSGKGLPFSEPTLIPREQFGYDDSLPYPPDQARDILSQAKKHKVPGMFEVLQIMRGDGSREQHKSITNKFRKESVSTKKTGNSSSNRGIFNKQNNKEPGILEGLRQNVGTSKSGEFIKGPAITKKKGRNGSKNRGWK